MLVLARSKGNESLEHGYAAGKLTTPGLAESRSVSLAWTEVLDYERKESHKIN